MIPADLSPLENHLWQSSLCVAGVWLLAHILGNNRAAVRYWLWLAASAKFLVPFSLLVSLGGHLAWQSAPASWQPQWTFVIDNFTRSVAVPTRAVQATTPLSSSLTPALLFVVWICGFAVSILLSVRYWRQIRNARCKAIPLPFGLPIPVLSSPTRLEPGVFGIHKPVLLLPEGIADVLAPRQLEAILAHELCHVRRRDNLTAAIHLLAETIFWFFPLLWWIRTRLVEERERACDEEVLRLGTEPRAYAEGILKVCGFYLESRIACAAGATGANLKQRIEAIVENQIKHNLNVGKKLLLAAAALTFVTGPLVVGVINGPPILRAQSLAQPKFDVASIRPSAPDAQGIFIRPIAGGLTITNMPVKELIVTAYRIQPFQLSGGPTWISSDRYDISAKSERPPKREEIPLMLQALLADRFQLAIHRETKELPVYALVVARKNGKLGPNLVEAKGDNCVVVDTTKPPSPPEPGKSPVLSCGGIRMQPNALRGVSVQIRQLTPNLSRLLGRTVVDKTGLTGKYDISMEWAPDESQFPQMPGAPSPPPSESAGLSIFTAVQEQLGLKLEAQKGPVETIVIDRVEKPTTN